MLGSFLVIATSLGDAERNIPIGPFHVVELAARATVQLEQAPFRSVLVAGEPRLTRCVTADVQGGRLVLGWAAHQRKSERTTQRDNEIVVVARFDCPPHGDPRRLSIKVTMPTLDAVTLRERGVIRVAPMRSSSFEASIVERGIITIEGLRADNAKLSIGGSGRISASGELGRLAISIAGSGIVDTREARATSLEVKIGGHGSVAAYVDGPASGSLAGSGTIVVGGRARCAIAKPGGGRIICPAASS